VLYSETEAAKAALAAFQAEENDHDDFYSNDIIDPEYTGDDRLTTASTSPRSRGRDASSRSSRLSEEEGLVPESVDMQSSHAIMEGLALKLKRAQEDWKLQVLN
jgi:hypothetical protein